MKKIVGYTNVWSVAPGDTLEVKVSTYGPERYEAQLVRVICGDDDLDRSIFSEKEIAAPFNGEYPGRTQVMEAGSFVTIPSCPEFRSLENFTVQAWVFPTTPEKGEQGLVSHWCPNSSAGFAMIVDKTGALALRLGDDAGNTTELSAGKPLAKRRWHLVSASFDKKTATAEVRQEFAGLAVEPSASARAKGKAAFAAATAQDLPLVMAALPSDDATLTIGMHSHFNGKIDRPRLTGRALSADRVASLAWDNTPGERESDLIAAWDFSRDIGSARIGDAGFNDLNGQAVNLPSRGVKGFNWSGREQNWRQAPHEYGAIHFHDDDHYDARWETDFEFVIPGDLKSGIYAARLRAEDDEWQVTFFVRPPRGKATSKLAFLASTMTYLAYSNYRWQLENRYAEVTESFWTTLDKGDAFLQEHAEFGCSTYDTHRDGSGVRYASRLRPVLNVAPRTPLWSFNADTHITGWLDAAGIDYDVITDEDLHHEGVGLLENYRAVVTGAHPEYFTTPMWDGMRAYLAHGGRLAYLGGNGFIWRCALSDEMPGVLELRRAEDGIRYRDEEPGEHYLEFTGEYGGLWRRLGMAPQALVGVGTVAVGFDSSGYYKRLPAGFDKRTAFIFEGIGEDEIIGDFGILGGGASGSEIDGADDKLGTPSHTLIVARSEGHSPNTYLVPDETGFHHCAMDGLQNPEVRADMTFFETPRGGGVFSVGSIAWPASLPENGYDNNVARLSENVVRRFLDPEPFEMPEVG